MKKQNKTTENRKKSSPLRADIPSNLGGLKAEMAEEMLRGSARLLLGTDAAVLFLPAREKKKKKEKKKRTGAVFPETTFGPSEAEEGGVCKPTSLCYLTEAA